MTTQYIFPFLCFILAPVLAGNPCQGITLGGCDVPDDSRVGAHPYGLDVCQKLCQLDDDCLFWRHDNTTAGTKEECLFINTDYHQVIIRIIFHGYLIFIHITRIARPWPALSLLIWRPVSMLTRLPAILLFLRSVIILGTD